MRELYQEVIIDHGKRPHNFYVCPEANYIEEGFNPLCGDKITLYISQHKGIIENASFQGCGCAISIASASLMTEIIKNKNIKELKTLFNLFHEIVTLGKLSQDNNQADNITKLGKLVILSGVSEYPARVKCATLAWHTLMAALKDAEKSKDKENSPVIFFTDTAVNHIKKLMGENKQNIGFRLGIKKSGCTGFAYVPDIIKNIYEEDIYFLAEQNLPVYIDPKNDALTIIKNTILDFVDKGAGQKQLVYNNPNVKDQCGCGESFNVK